VDRREKLEGWLYKKYKVILPGVFSQVFLVLILRHTVTPPHSFIFSWVFLGEVEQLEIDLAKSKASEEEIRFKYREADIKLNALQDYFKNMESDLHR
jgi:hypothetical protein